ncbi:MAG: hypothetical protein ACYTGP_06245 [Planctomycetota bacterium]|jgi:hypothetical protein
MPDVDVIKSLCCLAGADSDVTVEELQLLGNLAGHVGIARDAFNAEIEKTRHEETVRQRHFDLVMSDADASMTELIHVAKEGGAFEEGHAMMLFWRLATKLEMEPGHFEELLAASQQA